MEIVPTYTGASDTSCQAQLARSRGPAQTIDEIFMADSLALNDSDIKNHVADVHYSGCGCRISENGCIDPSECRAAHTLYRVPVINRWCDQTTCQLRGAGALILWSGSARPAVLKILGRHPTVEQVIWLIQRSHPKILHSRWKFDFTTRMDEDLNEVVIDVHSNQLRGYRASTRLRVLNPTMRFGQHSTLKTNDTFI